MYVAIAAFGRMHTPCGAELLTQRSCGRAAEISMPVWGPVFRCMLVDWVEVSSAPFNSSPHLRFSWLHPATCTSLQATFLQLPSALSV